MTGATGATGAAWAELLRVSALFTVPGDALAGAAAARQRPNRGTALAVCTSLCFYEAGMALNDWADRDLDAIERPHRPLPSGRITPGAALAAAGGLTAAGLTFAAAAGRPAFATATALACAVWAYDLGLKNTPAGAVAMAATRTLDLLLGAAATSSRARREAPPTSVLDARIRPGVAGGRDVVGCATAATVRGLARTIGQERVTRAWSPAGLRADRDVARRVGLSPGIRAAVPSAALLGAHTLAVTAVSRREAQGGSSAVPLAALAATAAIALGAARGGGRACVSGTSTTRAWLPAGRRGRRDVAPRDASAVARGVRAVAGAVGLTEPGGAARGTSGPARWWNARPAAAYVTAGLAATYAATAGRPYAHAVLNPSPQLTQRAVGGGIRAMIPLQAVLAARAGAVPSALSVIGLIPIARRFSRKVSPT